MAVASSLVSLLSLVAIYGILAIGLNIKFGYTGLLEIGHAAFYLIGAYTTALLVSPPAGTLEYTVYILGWNWPWLPALAAGALVAALAGVLVSLPAIRLREDYLAIVTLGVSIIAMRIVQTETWIANGPDSLSSFNLPLRSLMPLPGDSPGSAALLGLVVFVSYLLVTYGTYHILNNITTKDRRAKLIHAVIAVTSLGVGYVAARFALSEDGPSAKLASVAVGTVTGVIAAVSAISGDALGLLAVLVFIGDASLFSWVLGGVLTASFTNQFSRRDLLTSLGVAFGFVFALAPAILAPTLLGSIISVAFFVTFGVALHRVGTGWATSSSRLSFLRILGASGVWLFTIRYFLLSIVGPLTSGDFGRVILDTIQNVLWLLQISPAGIRFDYSRLLLIGSVIMLAGVYWFAELVVQSPYGRVLKAIREDQEVAASLGKGVFSYKVQSMALGSGIAGLAGGLTAIYFRTLTYQMFHPRVTFFILLIVIIGGMANNKGMILGAVVYWGFQQGTGDIAALFPSGGMRTRIQAIRLALFGLMFVAILYYRPEGLIPERLIATEDQDE